MRRRTSLGIAGVLIVASVAAGLPVSRFFGRNGPVSAKCPKPLAHWDNPATGKSVWVAGNWLVLKGHAITWNGKAVTFTHVDRYTKAISMMSPIPATNFDPSDAADCRFAEQVRDIIGANLDCVAAPCWQGSRSAFDRAKWNGRPVQPW